MTGFFDRLAAGTFDPNAVIRPCLSALFEPPTSPSTLSRGSDSEMEHDLPATSGHEASRPEEAELSSPLMVPPETERGIRPRSGQLERPTGLLGGESVRASPRSESKPCRTGPSTDEVDARLSVTVDTSVSTDDDRVRARPLDRPAEATSLQEQRGGTPPLPALAHAYDVEATPRGTLETVASLPDGSYVRGRPVRPAVRPVRFRQAAQTEPRAAWTTEGVGSVRQGENEFSRRDGRSKEHIEVERAPPPVDPTGRGATEPPKTSAVILPSVVPASKALTEDTHPIDGSAVTAPHALIPQTRVRDRLEPFVLQPPDRGGLPPRDEPVTTVHVRIGRVEVRSVQPTRSLPKRGPSTPVMSLEEYLRRQPFGGGE